VISTRVAAGLLSRDSIYTVKLRRLGIIVDGMKKDPLQSMIAGEVMIRDPQYVREEMSVSAISGLVVTKLHM
jgi:hypothetical protein